MKESKCNNIHDDRLVLYVAKPNLECYGLCIGSLYGMPKPYITLMRLVPGGSAHIYHASALTTVLRAYGLDKLS